MSACMVSSTVSASKYSNNRKALSLWLTLNAGRKRGSNWESGQYFGTRVGEGLRSD